MSEIRSRRRVLIEYVTSNEDRNQGDRVYVDPRSATSLVDRKKVAKRVGDTPVAASPAPPAGDDD